MQMVGRGCEECDAAIPSINHGYACLGCEKAWHVDCIAQSEGDGDAPPVLLCPVCGIDFRETRARIEAAVARETAARIAKGARIFFLGAVPILLFGLATAWLRWSTRGSPLGFGRFALTVGLLWMVWRGHVGARKLTTLLLSIGAGLALLGAVVVEDVPFQMILVGMGGVNAAFAGALALSEPLRTFLQRQGREHGVAVRER